MSSRLGFFQALKPGRDRFDHNGALATQLWTLVFFILTCGFGGSLSAQNILPQHLQALAYGTNSRVGLTFALRAEAAQLSATNYAITEDTHELVTLAAAPGALNRHVRVSLNESLATGKVYQLRVVSPPAQANLSPGLGAGATFALTRCPPANTTNCPEADLPLEIEAFEPTAGATVTYNVLTNGNFSHSIPSTVNGTTFNARATIVLSAAVLGPAPNPHEVVICAGDGIPGHLTLCCTSQVWIAAITPTFRCPGEFTTNLCERSAPIHFRVPAVADGVLASCIPPSGSLLSVGTTRVICVATNTCATNTCAFDVTVQQTLALSMGCPSGVLTNVCGTNAVVTFAAPSVTNGVLRGCVPPSGSIFGLGVTPVVCTATNACSTNTCGLTVTVQSIEPVALACPAAMTTNICGTNVVMNYPLPTATNGVLVGCTPPSGSRFGSGITVVRCLATNGCSTNGCTFNVAVLQSAAVTIACPSPRQTNTCGINQVVTFPNPIVTAGTLRACIPPSGTAFTVGITSVRCTATNLCSTNTCNFSVTVERIQGVSMTCPTDPTFAVCEEVGVVNYTLPSVRGGALRDCKPASGAEFPVGRHVVTCTATNRCETNTCEFMITVEATPVMTLVCPSDVATNTCGASVAVNYPLPQITNGTLVACLPLSGTVFPIGTTPVNCVVTNRCGSNACTFNVLVRPLAEITLLCPTNLVLESCGTNLSVGYPTLTVSNGALANCTPPSGSVFRLGTTAVRCTATNLCATNVCSFDVTVVRPGAVELVCPPALATNICGTNSVVSYPLPTVAGGALSGCTPTNGSVLPVGLTTVICTATNACATNSCIFNVTVRSAGAITFNCPSSVVTNVCDGSVVVRYSNPTASGGTVIGCTPLSGSTFVTGTTSVVCTATNMCSTNTCAFTVLVRQVLPVTLTCSTDLTTNSCDPEVVMDYATPVVSNGALVNCQPPNGSLFRLGTTTVTCTATNECSTNACTFSVTVTDDGCGCLLISNARALCPNDSPNEPNYTFDWVNNGDVPVSYLFLVPKGFCYETAPDILRLQPPLPPGQRTNVSVRIRIESGCAADLCFLVTAHDSNFVQCCAVTHCVPGGLRAYLERTSGIGAGCDERDPCCARICGTKFHDLNANGRKDPLEPGLAGWMIVARDAASNVVATALTDTNGHYCLNLTAPGVNGTNRYHVAALAQTNWVQTLPAAGSYEVLVIGPLMYGDRDFGSQRRTDCEQEAHLTVARDGGDVVLTWSAEGYRLQSAAALANPSGATVWTNVRERPPVKLPPSEERRFFRLVCP